MTKPIVYLSLLLSLVFYSFKPGKTLAEEYKKALAGILKKQNALVPGKGVSMISYTMKTSYQPGQRIADKVNDVALYLHENQRRIVSSLASVYMDSLSTIMIMPLQKRIFISNSELRTGVKQDKLSDQYGLFQEKYLESSEVEDCHELTEKGRELKYILLKSSETYFKNSGIRSVEFVFDEIRQQVLRQKVSYGPSSTLLTSELLLKEMKLGYRDDSFSQQVMNLILGKDQKLKPAYRDFKVVDKRRKRHKDK